jgi:acyl dehydratase
MQAAKKALNAYEDMPLGKVFNHHWGRTLHACDNIIFCSETGQYNPTYFNVEYARSLGYEDIPVHPLFVFNVVGGMTVEDLSEGGGLFLGIDNLNNLKPVYPGDTLASSSEIVERRLSKSRPGWGIITWRTRGVNQRDELVIEFDKTNLVRCRNTGKEA